MCDFIISILQLRTLRLRELKSLPLGHTASDWKWWDLKPGQLTSARKSWHSLGLRCDIEIYTIFLKLPQVILIY